MPVLVDQDSPTLYLGEDGSASASVGEGDMDTPMLGGMEHLSLIRDMVIHTMARVMPRLTGICIDIHELHSCQDKLRVTKSS